MRGLVLCGIAKTECRLNEKTRSLRKSTPQAEKLWYTVLTGGNRPPKSE